MFTLYVLIRVCLCITHHYHYRKSHNKVLITNQKTFWNCGTWKSTFKQMSEPGKLVFLDSADRLQRILTSAMMTHT